LTSGKLRTASQLLAHALMKRLTVSALVVATSVLGCNHGLPFSPGSPDLGSQAPGNCNLTIHDGAPTTVTVAGWCVSSPGRMVVDQASVTVVSRDVVSGLGTLVRIDKASGAQTLLVGKAGDPGLDGTLADGGTELFFAACDAGKHCSIFAVPPAGGALRTVAASDASVVDTYHATFDLAVDAANVYWLTDGIWSAPRAGGVARRLGDGAAANDRPFAGIAVDASAVYATRPSAGIVIRQPLDGSAATTLATGQATPSRIVVAGGTIYWLEYGTTETDCVRSDGTIDAWSSGSERSLATGLAGASFAVVGGKLVYAAVGAFCNAVSAPLGSINELSLPASAPAEVAHAQLLPGNVASDGTEVYWTVVSDYDGTGAIVHAALR
jgi:hypothetical protein